MENTPGSPDHAWRVYLALLGCAIGGLVGLNLMAREPGHSSPISAVRDVAHLSPIVLVFAALLMLAGLAGVGLWVTFLTIRGGTLNLSPRPRIQAPVLILSFLSFLAGFVGLGLVGAVVIILLGVSESRASGAVIYIFLQCLVMLGALAIALSVLKWLTAYTREDARDIGWRVGSLDKAMAWGVGGYMAALPLMFVALLLTHSVTKIWFKHVETPEHPIVPLVARGGPVFVAAFVLAVVVAPIVEETCFRGMLYNALRGRMGVWGASIISAAIFALVHPTLPAGFLPILALGCVLALLRESTGSLIPCMVCHAANNAVALLMVRLIY